MNIRVLTNKKFRIPTELVKDVEIGAKQEELKTKIEQMTEEQYEEYVRIETEKADIQIANGQFGDLDETMKEIKEYIDALDREHQNYNKCRNIIDSKRKKSKLRHKV